MRAIACLEKIAVGNETALSKNKKVVATLIQFVQTFQHKDGYEICFLDIADSLRGILKGTSLSQVVTALKDYLGETVYRNDAYRYQAAYSPIWHCAQNMTYPDFYNAWHNSLYSQEVPKS